MSKRIHRVGIVPFDIRDEALAVLFITSQTRGRWVLPKGKVEANESHVEACHREGFEEAGVRGVVLEDFPITIVIGKQTNKGVRPIPVTYYPFFVQLQEDDWPERDCRQRHWTLIEDAHKVAYRDDFLDLISQIEALRPWLKETAEHHKEQLQEVLTPVR